MSEVDDTLKKLLSSRYEQWLPERVKAIRKFPSETQTFIYHLVGLDNTGAPLTVHISSLQERENEVHVWLAGMSADERRDVVEALFPNMAGIILDGWELNRRLPYQSHYERRPFRAPSQLELVLPRQVEWLRWLVQTCAGLSDDVTWFAKHAAEFQWFGGHIAILLAAALERRDAQADEVFEILKAAGSNEGEAGLMGRPVTGALLLADREDGWDFVERLLLAAQRQEGLRQVIVESAGEAHPAAFRRLLAVIRDNDLARFSSIVRAVDVWLGYQWDSASVGVINKVLDDVIRYWDSPQARQASLQSGNGEAVYLSLWTIAFQDAFEAISAAVPRLNDSDVERRFAATHLLASLDVVEANQALIPMLADKDLRVAARALDGIVNNSDPYAGYNTSVKHFYNILCESELFERLEEVIEKFPKKGTADPLIWPWMAPKPMQHQVAAAMLKFLGNRDKRRLIPYIPLMDPHMREHAVVVFGDDETWDDATRDTIFSLVGDASVGVRERALRALKNCTTTFKEAQRLESLLTRTASDLRRGVLTLLAKLPDEEAIESAQRLIKSRSAPQRLGGLEILRTLFQAKRKSAECRSIARAFQGSGVKISKEEQTQIDAIVTTDCDVPTLDDALGLMDPAARTMPPRPQHRNVAYMTPAAFACLKSLYVLIEANRNTPVNLGDENRSREWLLGSSPYTISSPHHNKPIREQLDSLPLAQLWEDWYANRGSELKDDDGLELERAGVRLSLFIDRYPNSDPDSPLMAEVRGLISGKVSIDDLHRDYATTTSRILDWLIALHPAEGSTAFLLEGLEHALAQIADEIDRARANGELLDGNSALNAEAATDSTATDRDREQPFRPKRLGYEWRSYSSPISALRSRLRIRFSFLSDSADHADRIRFWKLLRWIDEPGIRVLRDRPQLDETIFALLHGAANENDFLDHVLGPREGANFDGIHGLGQLTVRRLPQKYDHPIIRMLVAKCRQRILEVERARGEEPTAASEPAMALRDSGGVDTVVGILEALGKTKFDRSRSHWLRGSGRSKGAVFSHLLRVSRPLNTDTPEQFVERIKSAEIDEDRLIDLALFAPQWADYVDRALQWPGLEDAVWWIYAHTKEHRAGGDTESGEGWIAAVSQRSPLSADDLMRGGVDVAWFYHANGRLQRPRWDRIVESAKYASTGVGHTRATLFAAAMLGDQQLLQELIDRVLLKRHQDSVCAIGLVPLASGKNRDADVLKRYQVLQEFIRTGKKFGSMRKESEKNAARIGLENLARSAGYPDPLRLQWAMEAKESADLAAGPIVVRAGDVQVELAIDDEGQPQITITKNDKPLKSIPASAKKNADIAELTERKTALKRQMSRMRQSLEQAMCRGDEFTGAEIQQLVDHPILRPMLERLVLIGNSGMGYPVDGKTLEDCSGEQYRIKKADTFRIAHPHDFLPAKTWNSWQRNCFERERIQPFKQVFRELYIVTAAEKKDHTISRRYAGHQVHPRQAAALLGSRGWVFSPEEGACRTFHQEKLTAWIDFLEPFYTPADVEGLTLESLGFHRNDSSSGKPPLLTEIPPRIFSEVMRDLDLVVSVAHRGGVDPEASASTIEMRTSLLKETMQLLGLKNVRVNGSHALIKGELGEYSVHLGSAIVHRQPGGALFIVPVHSQHRGRLFLPFADDDPKTAEVLSKVLLLARDREIQDPNILDQIRAIR